MKYILILLFSLTAFAQTDSISQSNISVISAEKLNVVYRGIDNPIKIAMPGAVSFTASAPGLRKGTSEGNYILNPGQGKEVTIIIIVAKMPNGKYISEKKAFRVMGLPAPMGILNDDTKGSYLMTVGMLTNAQVNIIFDNVLIFESNVDFGVTQFNLTIPLKHNKSKTIIVSGNKMNNEAITLLNKLIPGDIIIISEIKVWNKTDIFIDKPPSPIAIEIYKD